MGYRTVRSTAVESVENPAEEKDETMSRSRAVFPCCIALLLLLGVGGSNEASEKNVSAGKASDKGRPDNYLTLDLGQGVTMKLALVPAGKFLMGSKVSAAEVARMFNGREGHHIREHPRREVTISRPFLMGIHEVTQAQWWAIMGTEPWKGKAEVKPGASYAASWVNWHEASEFCENLSKKTGTIVTLPTEAQWEYACRARTETIYYCGNDLSKLGDYAWYRNNTRKVGEEYAHRVGTEEAQRLGFV